MQGDEDNMETNDSKDEAAMVRSIANQSCAGCEKPLTEENLQAVAWLSSRARPSFMRRRRPGRRR